MVSCNDGCDFTNSTANDTTRFYVNGVRVSQSQITTTNVASGNGANGTGLQLFEIGRHNGTEYSDGYIADYHFIWDVAKTDPFEFIQTYRGVLIPKAYTGSYGTYGFHLDFADSALTASGIGDDNVVLVILHQPTSQMQMENIHWFCCY